MSAAREFKTAGELARDALRQTHEERAQIPYVAPREPIRLNVSPAILDVTGSRPSSGIATFLAGAACGALALIAFYFSL